MRRTVMFAVAAMIGAVIAGCDSTTEPAPPPTSEEALTTATQEPAEDAAVTSEPAATTEAPAAGPPEMPDEAMEQTEEGAEAFVAHFLDTYNYSYRTGEGDPLSALGAPNCASCASLAEGLPSEASDGPDYLTFEPPSGLLTADQARVEAPIQQRATSDDAAVRGTTIFSLVWREDAWAVSEIQIQQS